MLLQASLLDQLLSHRVSSSEKDGRRDTLREDRPRSKPGFVPEPQQSVTVGSEPEIVHTIETSCTNLNQKYDDRGREYDRISLSDWNTEAVDGSCHRSGVVGQRCDAL
jgi:hypothetical protein